MLCPTCHLVVSRLSFKCGLPISSDFVPDVLSRFFPSCLRFHSTPAPPSCLPPADWVPSYLSIAFQLFPSCLPSLPIVFQLDPLDLNLTPSLLLVCTAGFIVSDSLDVFLYLPPSPLCLPLWPMASGLWMPVFTGLSLLVSQSGSRRLVVSGCPDVFSLHSLVSHHVSLTIFLRIYISVSQLIRFQSSVCLSGGGWFFCLFAFARVFHRLLLTMCLPLHGSSHSYVPLVAVSCSCFSTFSFVISPLSLFFSPFVSSSSLRCYTCIDPPR